MASPSLATFRVRFPEFAPVGDSTVQFWLDDVTAEMSDSSNWGKGYGVAVETFAAHKLSISQARSAGASVSANGAVEIQHGGVITSAGGDGLSVSFAAPASVNGNAFEYELSRTSYGIEYMSIMRQFLSRGRVASV